MFKNKNGFTFVEILAVLGVLGTIAVLTLPNFLLKSKEEAFIRSKQAENMRLTEALGQMNLNKQFSISDTNEIFVNKFAEYMKIAKRCDSTHLDGCFASTFKMADGEEIKLSSLTKGTNLDKTNNTEPLAGFVLLNGSSYVMALKSATDEKNASCLTADPLSDRKSCVSMLYDINGSAKPNVIGRDIVALNVTGLGCSGYKTADGTCFQAAFIPTPLTAAQCNAKKGALGISNCFTASDIASRGDNDYWAGAVATCGGINNMPNQARLETLSNELYGVSNCGPPNTTCTGMLDYTTAVRIGLPSSGSFFVWTSTELTSLAAQDRYFSSTLSGQDNNFRSSGTVRAICLNK